MTLAIFLCGSIAQWLSVCCCTKHLFLFSRVKGGNPSLSILCPEAIGGYACVFFSTLTVKSINNYPDVPLLCFLFCCKILSAYPRYTCYTIFSGSVTKDRSLLNVVVCEISIVLMVGFLLCQNLKAQFPYFLVTEQQHLLSDYMKGMHINSRMHNEYWLHSWQIQRKKITQ